MKRLKYLTVLLIICGLGFLYLNRSYAYIYDHISQKNLRSPTMNQEYILKSQTPTAQNKKYVALGDSLSAGVGANSFDQTFPYLLAEKLAQENNISLVNLGVPGAKTKDVISSQISQAITLNPDYLTLLIGINDIHGLIPVKKFQANFTEIINRLMTETKAKITVINIPYLGSSHLILPPYNFYFDQQTKKYNEIIQKITEQKSICYIDLYNQTKTTFAQNKKLYSSDLFHPSAEGYRLWADIIYADSNCFTN